MSKLKVTTISDPDNDNTAISVDSSGNLTVPQNLTVSGTLSGDGSSLTGITMPTVGYGAFQATFGTMTATWNTNTKITFNSELYDYDNLYDPSNARYQPDVAGLYFINSFVQFTTPYNGWVALKLYKNGSRVKDIITESPNTANYPSAQFSSFIPMNGTTDYLEMYIYQDMGTDITLYGSDWGNFGGYLVREA